MDAADPSRRIAGAVRAGRIDDVRRLLDAGARPDQMNIYGDTLVDMALDRGHDDVAAFLEEALARAKRVAVSPTHTDHPIHPAAEARSSSRSRAARRRPVARSRQRSRRRNGAAPRGDRPCARRCLAALDRGADIHAIHGEGLGTRDGYAPENLQAIDLAIWGGPSTIRPSRWSILRACFKGWLWRLRTPRDATITPRPSDEPMARLLIARGATYDLPIAAALGDLDRAASMIDGNPSRLRETRPNGRLALSAAAEFARLDVAKLLLDRGADPTWPDVHDSAEGGVTRRPPGDRSWWNCARPRRRSNGRQRRRNSVYAARTPEFARSCSSIAERSTRSISCSWTKTRRWCVASRPIRSQLAAAAAYDRGLHAASASCSLAFSTWASRCIQRRWMSSYLVEQPDMLGCCSAWRSRPELSHRRGRDASPRALRPRHPRTKHRAATPCAAVLLDAGATSRHATKVSFDTARLGRARNLPDMVEFLLSRGAPRICLTTGRGRRRACDAPGTHDSRHSSEGGSAVIKPIELNLPKATISGTR